MSVLVTMSSTVGSLTSGQTYRVRSRYAETLVQTSKATKQLTRKFSGVNPAQYEGK